MDYLCECSTDRDRLEALEKLPPDLPSSYERILERVNRSSRQNQILVRNTLHWIAYAEKPLSDKQLHQALAIRPGDSVFDSSSMATNEELLHWCSSLLRRNSTSTGFELAHFTVKEYLLSLDPMVKPHFSEYCLPGDHWILVNTCTTILECTTFDGALTPKIISDSEQFQASWKEFMDQFCFLKYAAVHWMDHYHQSSWERIEKGVLKLFLPRSKNIFKFWIFSWMMLTDHHGLSNSLCVPLLNASSCPGPIHFAACFALDKVCSSLIAGGVDVTTKSYIMGTPVRCAMLGYDALSTVDPLAPGNHKHWVPRPHRATTLKQLFNAIATKGVISHPGIGDEDLLMTIKSDASCDEPIMTYTLLDYGAKLSTDCIQALRDCLTPPYAGSYTRSGRIETGEWLQSCWEADDKLWISPYHIIERVIHGRGKNLEHDAHPSFFAYVLEVVSFHCPLVCLSAFCEMNFGEFFQAVEVQELEIILENRLENRESIFVKALSWTIRKTSESVDEARGILQKSLFTLLEEQHYEGDDYQKQNKEAFWSIDASTISLLFKFNVDLNPSFQDTNGDSYLHYWLRTKRRDNKFVLQTFIEHGASVTIANKAGVSPIEIAAEECKKGIFRLFWGSARSSEALNTSSELGKKIFYKALGARNHSVIQFLSGKLFAEDRMPQQSWLQFDASQQDNLALKSHVEQWYSFQSGKESDEENDEDDEESDNEDEDAERDFRKELGKSIDNAELIQSTTETTVLLACGPRISLSSFKSLLDQGFLQTMKDLNGNSPIHILSQNREAFSVEKLQVSLKYTLDLNGLNNQGDTPLQLAVLNNNILATSLLLDSGAYFSCRKHKTTKGLCPLHSSVRYGRKEILELLLKTDPGLEVQMCVPLTPLLLATSCGQWCIANYLLKSGANPEARSPDGQCFLHWAGVHGTQNALEYFFIKFPHCKLDVPDQYGMTPLRYAVGNANLGVFKLLLEHGVSVEAVSPAMSSCYLAFDSVIPEAEDVRRELLKSNIDWKTKTTINYKQGSFEDVMPIHLAALQGKASSIRFLLRNKLTEVDQFTKEGLTPLWIAVMFKRVECANILLEYGADPLYATTNGATYLHAAAESGSIDLVRILLRHGCDPCHRNRHGLTPKDTAGNCGHLLPEGILQAAIEAKSATEETGTELSQELNNSAGSSIFA